MIEHRDCFQRRGGGWLGWWERGLAPDLWVYVPALSFASSVTLAESPYFSVPPFVNSRMSSAGLQGITGADFILFFKVKQIPRPKFFFFVCSFSPLLAGEETMYASPFTLLSSFSCFLLRQHGKDQPAMPISEQPVC